MIAGVSRLFGGFGLMERVLLEAAVTGDVLRTGLEYSEDRGLRIANVST